MLKNVSYGLFLLTANDGEKDNGCITNVVVQVTATPLQFAIALNKSNFTHDMVLKTGIFNVSVLTEQTPMELIRHFGFQSGREVDKFGSWPGVARSENGLLYLTEYTNSFLSGKVVRSMDMGTHTLFVAEITEAEVRSNEASLTYSFYQQHIKPQPVAVQGKNNKWVCQVCGYEYEGDELPADFICPWCKHGAADFKRSDES